MLVLAIYYANIFLGTVNTGYNIVHLNNEVMLHSTQFT